MRIFVDRIIPKNTIAVESNWQKELANCFTTLESLLEFLEIDIKFASENNSARKLFAMKVPRHFAELMKKGDSDKIGDCHNHQSGRPVAEHSTVSQNFSKLARQ